MNGKATAYRIVIGQLLATLVLAAAVLALWGAAAAGSALAGGLISVTTSLAFAVQLFGRGVRPARKVLASFFLAEAVKFVLTVALFALAIVWLEARFLPLLAGYGLTLVIYWLALLPAAPFDKVNHA
jgi:ATP synthase protein I